MCRGSIGHLAGGSENKNQSFLECIWRKEAGKQRLAELTDPAISLLSGRRSIFNTFTYSFGTLVLFHGHLLGQRNIFICSRHDSSSTSLTNLAIEHICARPPTLCYYVITDPTNARRDAAEDRWIGVGPEALPPRWCRPAGGL